jgi:hypothetical protein
MDRPAPTSLTFVTPHRYNSLAEGQQAGEVWKGAA